MGDRKDNVMCSCHVTIIVVFHGLLFKVLLKWHECMYFSHLFIRLSIVAS